MQAHPLPLSTAAEIEQLAARLKDCDLISFDTEFIREQTFFPVVELIQVATDDESWLVDANAFKKGYAPGPQGGFNQGLSPLLEIFENQKILKIVHAAQGDEECLYTSFGRLASPTLDTAVAASLCGYGDGIGLGRLLKLGLDVTIKKGHSRTNWSVRPLPEQLIQYAHEDVKHLVALGRKLLTRLDELGRREWALELSSKWSDPRLYEPDVDGIAAKLIRGGHLDRKAQAVLLQLVRWREERVRQLNLPRRWVADDSVLLDLARVRPKDIAHLGAFRGLNKGELRNSGEALLKAIENAGAIDERLKTLTSERQDAPNPDESQVLDLVRFYVGILADRHRIAAKHLATAAQLLPLLRNKIEGPADLVRLGVLSQHAAELIGEELIAFLNGNRAVSVDGRQIKIVEVS
ncbi:MAG: hypothetical protein A2X94_12355 [Bdellovibrionales bacterium GWB1_55_8]|nr:MAG: hypothetical protein A2X94_12355 [Bdellovibrionales bacterium GWB1_55_8]